FYYRCHRICHGRKLLDRASSSTQLLIRAVAESGDAIEDLDDVAEQDEGDPISLLPHYPWERSDRDYQYVLLGRMFNILHDNKQEFAGDKRRTVLRPPQVLRCIDHVMAFFFAELSTSGSLDGQQGLIVKGVFTLKNFQGILQRYIKSKINMSLSLGVKVQTQYFLRRILSSDHWNVTLIHEVLESSEDKFGELYELDGRKSRPISHGPSSPSTLLK
ncbi:hypothetical protein S83_019781, partial [Arachis hypogaea]